MYCGGKNCPRHVQEICATCNLVRPVAGSGVNTWETEFNRSFKTTNNPSSDNLKTSPANNKCCTSSSRNQLLPSPVLCGNHYCGLSNTSNTVLPYYGYYQERIDQWPQRCLNNSTGRNGWSEGVHLRVNSTIPARPIKKWFGNRQSSLFNRFVNSMNDHKENDTIPRISSPDQHQIALNRRRNLKLYQNVRHLMTTFRRNAENKIACLNVKGEYKRMPSYNCKGYETPSEYNRVEIPSTSLQSQFSEPQVGASYNQKSCGPNTYNNRLNVNVYDGSQHVEFPEGFSTRINGSDGLQGRRRFLLRRRAETEFTSRDEPRDQSDVNDRSQSSASPSNFPCRSEHSKLTNVTNQWYRRKLNKKNIRVKRSKYSSLYSEDVEIPTARNCGTSISSESEQLERKKSTGNNKQELLTSEFQDDELNMNRVAESYDEERRRKLSQCDTTSKDDDEQNRTFVKPTNSEEQERNSNEEEATGGDNWGGESQTRIENINIYFIFPVVASDNYTANCARSRSNCTDQRNNNFEKVDEIKKEKETNLTSPSERFEEDRQAFVDKKYGSIYSNHHYKEEINSTVEKERTQDKHSQIIQNEVKPKEIYNDESSNRNYTVPEYDVCDHRNAVLKLQTMQKNVLLLLITLFSIIQASGVCNKETYSKDSSEEEHEENSNETI